VASFSITRSALWALREKSGDRRSPAGFARRVSRRFATTPSKLARALIRGIDLAAFFPGRLALEKRVALSLPRRAFVVATRAALGAGVRPIGTVSSRRSRCGGSWI